MNVDSGWDAEEGWLKHAAEWRSASGAPPVVLMFSNDIHELRAYNRLAVAASAELLVRRCTLNPGCPCLDRAWSQHVKQKYSAALSNCAFNFNLFRYIKVFAQDDDAPTAGSRWLETALWLFRQHDRLALLGGDQ